jgi:hypothetical protein
LKMVAVLELRLFCCFMDLLSGVSLLLHRPLGNDLDYLL